MSNVQSHYLYLTDAAFEGEGPTAADDDDVDDEGNVDHATG